MILRDILTNLYVFSIKKDFLNLYKVFDFHAFL